jgi:hypothetical protein
MLLSDGLRFRNTTAFQESHLVFSHMGSAFHQALPALSQYSKTNEMHFLYSVYYELTSSTCFEHYLLISASRLLEPFFPFLDMAVRRPAVCTTKLFATCLLLLKCLIVALLRIMYDVSELPLIELILWCCHVSRHIRYYGSLTCFPLISFSLCIPSV